MTNLMLFLVLWCLSKPLFTVAFIFMCIKIIFDSGVIKIDWGQ